MQINMAYLTLDLLCHRYAPGVTTPSTWTKTIDKYKETGKRLLKEDTPKKKKVKADLQSSCKNPLQLLETDLR